MPAPLRIHLTPGDQPRGPLQGPAPGPGGPPSRPGLDRTTLHRDLRRWPERGIEELGQRSYLVDGKPPGARPRWTPAMSAFPGELLAGEEAWTPPRLQEALERRYFVTFHPGTARRKLLEMGYRWVTRKRTF